MRVYILSTSAMPWGRWWEEKDRRRVGDSGLLAASSLLAQLTPSLTGGEDSWKEAHGAGCVSWPVQQEEQEDPDCCSTLLAGPRGRVPWEKAAFCTVWGMWAGDLGAEPEYRSVMAVVVEEEEDRPDEKESLRSLV